MNIKNKNKIDKVLTNHDSILKAITSYNCKDVLTVEQGHFLYWVRHYQNGRILNTYGYLNTLNEAITRFEEIKQEFIKYGVNLRFNEV
jgi:hypothetical protein